MFAWAVKSIGLARSILIGCSIYSEYRTRVFNKRKIVVKQFDLTVSYILHPFFLNTAITVLIRNVDKKKWYREGTSELMIFAKEIFILNLFHERNVCALISRQFHFYTSIYRHIGGSKYMHMRVCLIFDVHFVPRLKYLLFWLNYVIQSTYAHVYYKITVKITITR